jgi:hypothetical protein
MYKSVVQVVQAVQIVQVVGIQDRLEPLVRLELLDAYRRLSGADCTVAPHP